jgi:hypothetical protein
MEQNQALEALKMLGARTDLNLKQSEITKNTAQAEKDRRPPEPRAPLPGTPEWRQAEIDKAKIGAQYGYHPPAQQPLVQVQQPDGSVTYVPRDQAAGGQVPGKGKGAVAGTLAAPMAAKVGQYGEMLKKTKDLLGATESLQVSLGNSAASDVAQHGVGAFGMTVPGSRGVGSLLANRSPEYATYQAALTPWVLAAAHALSGARINQDQVTQIRNSIEIKPGDPPPTRAQKLKNMLDLVNSIGGSLPSDAVASQEAQMGPGEMDILRGHGYRASAAGGAAPHAAGSGGQPTHAQQLWDAAVAKHGKQKVIQEVGPRPDE